MPSLPHQPRSLPSKTIAGITITILAALALLCLLLFLLFSIYPKYSPLTHYRRHLALKREKQDKEDLAKRRAEAQALGLAGARDTRPISYGNYGNPNWKRAPLDPVEPVPVQEVDERFVVGEEGMEEVGSDAHRDERARGSTYDPFERDDEVERRGRTTERSVDRYESRGFGHGHGSAGKAD